MKVSDSYFVLMCYIMFSHSSMINEYEVSGPFSTSVSHFGTGTEMFGTKIKCGSVLGPKRGHGRFHRPGNWLYD
jgi:hypothetical protein